MGQPPCRPAAVLFFATVLCQFLLGCDAKPSPSSATTKPTGNIRIASLSPAATDLLIAMGAGDHLQAVSNFDPVEVNGRTLPRVGDYQTTDWETLSSLHLQAMVIQMDPGRLPPAFASKAQSLGMQLIDVRLNTIADIIAESTQLSDAVGELSKGRNLAKQISGRMDSVRHRCATLPKVRTLLTLNSESYELVGVGEFLNEALTAAGGTNVAESLGGTYPTADREMLAKLQPDVVIVLQPNAKPEALQQAKDFWSGLVNDAHRMPRVYLLSQSYVQLPASHVADIAESIANCLHGNAQP
jgi:ABC-type Fe3+-hydroxamate transport system substrate-binding protein